jgi:hypothetical protein
MSWSRTGSTRIPTLIGEWTAVLARAVAVLGEVHASRDVHGAALRDLGFAGTLPAVRGAAVRGCGQGGQGQTTVGGLGIERVVAAEVLVLVAVRRFLLLAGMVVAAVLALFHVLPRDCGRRCCHESSVAERQQHGT